MIQPVNFSSETAKLTSQILHVVLSKWQCSFKQGILTLLCKVTRIIHEDQITIGFWKTYLYQINKAYHNFIYNNAHRFPYHSNLRFLGDEIDLQIRNKVENAIIIFVGDKIVTQKDKCIGNILSFVFCLFSITKVLCVCKTCWQRRLRQFTSYGFLTKRFGHIFKVLPPACLLWHVQLPTPMGFLYFWLYP